VGKRLSVRVSDGTRRAVTRLAGVRGRSESDVVREAIEEYVARHPAEVHPYDLLKDVIGIVEDGPTDLSVKTGDKVRRMLRDRNPAKR
jgi:predicted DNA-binding protein